MHFSIGKVAVATGIGMVGVSLLAKCGEENEMLEKYFDALDYCEEVGKPLLNIGCGNNPRYIGDVNIDIQDVSILPDFESATIYEIPYPDKAFGAVICFNTLEHLDNPHDALAELSRVADRIYVVVPRFWDISAYFYPSHKQIFLAEKAIAINGSLNLVLLSSTILIGSAIALKR